MSDYLNEVAAGLGVKLENFRAAIEKAVQQTNKVQEKKMRKFTGQDVWRKFTREDVCDVIEYMAAEGMDITTLDVKNELRQDRLYATQNEVAPVVHEIMVDYVNNGEYTTKNNGEYVTYVRIDEDEDEDGVLTEGCYNVVVYKDGDIGMAKVEEDKWQNPINKTISFVYNGGNHFGEVREVIIKGMDETKLTGVITDNDPAYLPIGDNIRNFSYAKMEDVEYA